MLSAEEFKRLIDNNKAVKEMMQEVEEWVPQLHQMLEDPDNQFSSQDYEQFRGSLKAIRNFMNVPTVVYERKLAEEKGGNEDG